MKAFVSFVVLSLIVAGSAIGLHVRRDSQAAALRDERQAALVEELTQKLESLGERLASVERVARETPVAAAPAALLGVPPAGDDAAAETEETEETAGEEEGDAGARAMTRHLVASLGKDGERQFRDYVGMVYGEARSARREREAAEAEEKRKEFEELGKGPYGQYNRRVNTLGKQLAMDDRQMQRYHDLLASYHSRVTEMRKAIDWKDKGARQGFRDSESALQSEFDAHVAHLLNQQQAEDYAAMHPVEKSVAAAEGGAVVFKFAQDAAGAIVQEDIVGPRIERAINLIGGAPAGVEEAVLGLEIKQAHEDAARAAAEKLERNRTAPPGGE